MMRRDCVPRTSSMHGSLLRAITPRESRHGTVSSPARNGARVFNHLEHRKRTDDGRGAAGALEACFFGPLGQEILERISNRGRGGSPLSPPPETPQRCALHARISPTYPRRCASGRCTPATATSTTCLTVTLNLPWRKTLLTQCVN